MYEMPKLLGKKDTENMFNICCKKLGIEKFKKDIRNLVIYELTDGTRTSTDLSGWKTYFDGGIFILRLFHILNLLGSKNEYVLTTGEGHQVRSNYPDIMKALEEEVNVYSDYAKKDNVRLKFVGNFGKLRPSFRSSIKKLEKATAKNTGLTIYVLIDYSSDWAYKNKEFKKLPSANVIIKHTKGQVNEGLWLPGKLHGNSFVYVQNASVSTNWTDRQLTYLIAIALRSMVLHSGMQYSKSYTKKEIKEVRKKREIEMKFIHRKLEKRPTKRIVMFSHLGPEIYEF